MHARIRLKKIPTDIFHSTCSSNCIWLEMRRRVKIHWIGPLQSCDANVSKHINGEYYSPNNLSDWRCRCQSEYLSDMETWGYAATIMQAEHKSSEYYSWTAFFPIIKILSSDVFSRFISDAMIKGKKFVKDIMWLKKDLNCFYINVYFATLINAV